MARLLCFVALALCFASGLAIRCYECNSKNQAGCGDGSRLGSLYTDCSTIPGRDRCLRTTGPGDLVTRSCSSTGTGFKDGCQPSPNNAEVTVCLCAADYCNAGSPMRNSTWIFVLLAFAAYISGLCR